jgi:hypothetical protein
VYKKIQKTLNQLLAMLLGFCNVPQFPVGSTMMTSGDSEVNVDLTRTIGNTGLETSMNSDSSSSTGVLEREDSQQSITSQSTVSEIVPEPTLPPTPTPTPTPDLEVLHEQLLAQEAHAKRLGVWLVSTLEGH